MYVFFHVQEIQLHSHTQEEICKQAIIYKNEKSRPLNDYQKQVNKCSQDLAVRDATLLANRGKLLEAAKHVFMKVNIVLKRVI